MNINPISFAQNYLSKVNVQNAKTNSKETLDFVEYECCFYDLARLDTAARKWNKSPKNPADSIFKDYCDTYFNGGSDRRFYGLEDENGEIQGLCEVAPGGSEIKLNGKTEKDEKNALEITCLCTNPENAYTSGDRKYQGIGRKLFSEIVKLAKKQDKSYIALLNVNKPFWNNIPYLKSEAQGAIKVLDKDEFTPCASELDE